MVSLIHKFFLIYVFGLLVSACATKTDPYVNGLSIQESQNPSKLYPYVDKALSNFVDVEKLTKEAKVCDKIERGSRFASPTFKYGCFCGKGYPAHNLTAEKNVPLIGDNHRLALAKTYYDTKPIDEIDAACQRHDVCVLLAGKQTKQCNNEFIIEMEELKASFDTLAEQIEKNRGEELNLASRCSHLAGNMAFGIGLPGVEAHGQSSTEESGKWIGTFIATPLLVFGYVMNTIIPLPGRNEFCFVFDPMLLESKG